MVSESIVRTPARTRLLNGQEMNFRLGSIRTTSMFGSSRRTYLAAVALDRGGASGEAGAGQHAEAEPGGPEECPSRDHAHRSCASLLPPEMLDSRPGST